jgi:hypothetical protein
MKKISYHFPHYFALAGILVVATLGILMFPFDRNFQAAIAVSLSVGYFMWGIVHHSVQKDLYPIVIFEYFSVAALGLIVILSLIYRS